MRHLSAALVQSSFAIHRWVGNYADEGYFDPSIHSATPPWCEHAPECFVPCQYIPSLHLASAPVGSVVAAFPAFFSVGAVVFAAAAGAGAACGADLLLSTPPWPRHAPRPPVAVVPSLHVTVGLSAADATTTDAVTTKTEM